MKRVIALLAFLLITTTSSSAWAQGMPPLPVDTSGQAATPVPEFEVASVRPHKGDDNNMRMSNTPDGFSTLNITLQNLISSAYGIKQELVTGGPGWVASTRYDINAKVAGSDIDALKRLTPQQRMAMLKPLLAERFHLQIHIETRTLPVYELVVAKGGPKLTASAPPPPLPPDTKPEDAPKRGRWTMGNGSFVDTDLPISSLVAQLSYLVHRTVIDKTGLTGRYDMTLKWTPEEVAMKAGSEAGAETAPSIFTALTEQLGLKLVPSRGPVDTLVIDHVELPTEN